MCHQNLTLKMTSNRIGFLDNEADIRNHFWGFRILKLVVILLILIKCITYLFNPYLLATPDGISLYNGILQRFYEVRYFPQMALGFTIVFAVFSLFGKGNMWIGFLLFIGVYITENICFFM